MTTITPTMPVGALLSTPDGLRDWLTFIGDAEAGTARSPFRCPIACYLIANGHEAPNVGNDTIVTQAGICAAPTWAAFFVEQVDDQYDYMDTVSGSGALKLLARCDVPGQTVEDFR